MAHILPLVQSVSEYDARKIIAGRGPRGRFYTLAKDGKYVGVDNATGDAWTEEFETIGECIRWLKGEFEVCQDKTQTEESETTKMGNKNNPYFNSEGYSDPTAYEALKPILQADAALEGKLNFLVKVIKFVAGEAGFEIINRIELRDKKTGRLFK